MVGPAVALICFFVTETRSILQKRSANDAEEARIQESALRYGIEWEGLTTIATRMSTMSTTQQRKSRTTQYGHWTRDGRHRMNKISMTVYCSVQCIQAQCNPWNQTTFHSTEKLVNFVRRREHFVGMYEYISLLQKFMITSSWQS